MDSSRRRLFRNASKKILIALLRRTRSLLRHYFLGLQKICSRGTSHLVGLFRFVLWIPRVVPKVLSIYHRTLFQSHLAKHRVTFQEINRVFQISYINLDSRTDRRRDLEREFQAIGLRNAKRFPAVPDPNGALGCARSHIGVLQKFINSQSNVILVFEDDAELNCTAQELVQAINEFLAHPELDVLCLGFRLRAPQWPVSRNLAIANEIQTTICYLAKKYASVKLLEAFERSEKMLTNGDSLSFASIDQQWKIEQRQDLVFCVPRKKLVLHRASFSDVAGTNKSYE